MPNKQKLKNKGNYVGNLTGKFREQRLQDNRTRVSFVTLASSYSHFCRNSREPPYSRMGNRIGPYFLHVFLPNIKCKNVRSCQFSTRKGYMTFYLNKLQTKTKRKKKTKQTKPCIFRFIVLVYL